LPQYVSGCGWIARRGEQEPGALPLGETERVVRPVRPNLQRLQRQAQIVDRARRAREVIDDVDRFLDLEMRGDVVVQVRERVTAKMLHVLE
jgi:hypothetical protein